MFRVLVKDFFFLKLSRNVHFYIKGGPGLYAQKPRCSDAQDPRCPEVQIPRCPEVQIPRCPEAQMPRSPEAQMPRSPDAQTYINPGPPCIYVGQLFIDCMKYIISLFHIRNRKNNSKNPPTNPKPKSNTNFIVPFITTQ